MPRKPRPKPTPQPDAADSNYVNDDTAKSSEPATAGAKRGPKLTETQATTLKEVIATYWDRPTVQAVLAEEHPELAELVTEDTIRYYKRQIDSDVGQAIEQADQRVLNAGFARRGLRVTHLTRLYQRLERALDHKTHLTDVFGKKLFDKTGMPVLEVELRADVAREMRTILEQIAREVGQPLQALTQISVTNTTNNNVLVVPQTHEVIDSMREVFAIEAAIEKAGMGLIDEG